MAPGNRNARRAANRSATFQNLANGLGGQHIDGHAHQRQRHDGRAPHGVDVGDGIGGGNAAKVKRVVHDGHEEVGGGNQRLLVVELVDGRIVRRLNAHHQFLGDGHGRHAFQNVRQHARRNLAATATAVGQAGEAGLAWGRGAC